MKATERRYGFAPSFSNIFTPPAFSRTLHENIQGSEMLLLEGCGHAHHWEDLEKFNSATSMFMQKH